MNKFHITIVEEPEELEPGTDIPKEPIERLSIRVDVLDLAAITRLLTKEPTKPRKTRSDAGTKREGGK